MHTIWLPSRYLGYIYVPIGQATTPKAGFCCLTLVVGSRGRGCHKGKERTAVVCRPDFARIRRIGDWTRPVKIWR